jgi:hypothetical protein
MDLFQEYSIQELLITDIQFLGLQQQAWEFSRGMRLYRNYLYPNTGVVGAKDSYIYTISEDLRSITQLTRKIEWFDASGTKIIEKDVTPQLNIKNLRELNRGIRQGRVDYLIGAAEQLAVLASSLPEPFATDFVRASYSIDVIMSIYKQQIYDYVETGSIGFESVIKNEGNPIMQEILALNVRPPDAQFPQGLTIKSSIIHQLTGVY